MAPSSTVKSESWLDLTQISGLVEQVAAAREADKRWRKRQVAAGPASGRRASASLVDQCQQRRQQLKQADSSQSISSGSSNKQEHLLIRLRQRSYLNRSNSTTLSSNLSNSIDLNPPGSSAANQNLKQLSCAGQEHDDEPAANRRDLSFGLRSFRSRFERRFRQRAAKGADTRGSSPFARSWSSLSEHLNLRVNQLGHSWKNFLQNQGRSFDETAARRHEVSSLFAAPAQNGCRERLSSVPPGREAEGAEEAELMRVKRRLTADWISRHSKLIVASPPPSPLPDRIERTAMGLERAADARTRVQLRPGARPEPGRDDGIR